MLGITINIFIYGKHTWKEKKEYFVVSYTIIVHTCFTYYVHACTLSQWDAKGKENIIQSLTHPAQNAVSDQASQETTKLAQVLDNLPLLFIQYIYACFYTLYLTEQFNSQQ